MDWTPQKEIRSAFRSDTWKVVAAIIVAGALIALALYLRPAPGRYLFDTWDNQLRRYDTAKGTAIVCRTDGVCIHVRESNGRLKQTRLQSY
jgi:hypothetical protein